VNVPLLDVDRSYSPEENHESKSLIPAGSALSGTAARDEALGTCCIGLARPWFNLRSTKHELGLPEEYEVVVPIVLGHPKAWPESHGRRPAEIHWLG